MVSRELLIEDSEYLIHYASFAEKEGIKVGFGEVSGTILSSKNKSDIFNRRIIIAACQERGNQFLIGSKQYFTTRATWLLLSAVAPKAYFCFAKYYRYRRKWNLQSVQLFSICLVFNPPIMIFSPRERGRG